ncbi:DNA polymerase III subunit gamma/tau [Ferrimonas senticii]|uniref:DNA polymerase III subunit gamma/tau n=1 Tax=Ferrimonas senticii TaxID=394566 RepID=UPI0003FFDEC1|nr:DNA polymerase III subunit gamma/tau [Ferrimonas senticii]
MSYQVLARKWRPASFEQVVGQEHVLKALTHALQHNRLHHAYLFTGTRGVGKTSIARLLAKGLNCEQGITATPCGTCDSCVEISQGRFVDLLEIDAASRTKVDDTREILDNVQYQPVRGRFKVYLIDEVHMLSRHSFNALLKTLEEPPEHVKFLLATTDPQKLPVTVLSRCLQFNLKSVQPQRISQHLATVLDAEQISYESAALDLIARAADGSVRDGMSLTDQAIAHGAGSLILAQVQGMLGTIDSRYALQLLNGLCAGEPAQLLQVLEEVEQFAPDHDELLRQLAALMHQLALLQFNLKPHSELADNHVLQGVASQLDREQVQLWYQILIQGRSDLVLAPDPRSGLEMVLLRALAFAPAVEVAPMQAKQVTPVVLAPAAVAHVQAAASTTVAEAATASEATSASVDAPAPVATAATMTMTKPEPMTDTAAISAEEALAAEQIALERQAQQLAQSGSDSQGRPQPLQPEVPQYQDEAAMLAAMDAEQELLMSQAAEHFDDYQPEDYQPSPAAPTAASAAVDDSDPLALMKQILAEEKAQREHFAVDEQPSEDAPGKADAAAPTAASASSAPRTLARPPQRQQPAPAVDNDPPPWALDDAPAVQPVAQQQAPEPMLPIGQRPQQIETPPATAPSAVVAAPVAADLPLTVPAADEERELDMQWYGAIGRLGIGARPRQLAINSVLQRDGEQVVLNLRPEQRHLNSDSVVGPLQQALETLWQQAVSLRIEINPMPNRETPLEIRRRRQREKLEQAKVDLQADPVVQWFANELDAYLLEDSVAYNG